MIQRRKTRKVTLGDARSTASSRIGGDAPVSVQTMTAGYTLRHRQVRRRDQQARRRRGRHRPRRRAREEGHRRPQGNPAAGDRADRRGRALPLPARPGSDRSRRPQDPPQPRQHHRPRAGRRRHRRPARQRKLPIRVGVNEGSIVERKDKQKRLKELGGVFSDNKHGHFLAIMIAKLEEYLDIFHERGFPRHRASAPRASTRCW